MKKELEGYPAGLVDPEPRGSRKSRSGCGPWATSHRGGSDQSGTAVAEPEGSDPRVRSAEGRVPARLEGNDDRGPGGASEASSKENPDSVEAQRESRRNTRRAWGDTRRPPPPTRRRSGSPLASPALWPCPSAWSSSSEASWTEATARAQAALEEDPGRARQLLARVALARGDLEEAERQARLSMADAATESEGADDPGASPCAAVGPVPGARGRSRRRAGVHIEQMRAPAAGLRDLRADVLGRLGRFAEAEAELREQIRSAPGRAQSYASLAVLVALQNRSRDEVREILDSMAKANPGRETLLLGAKTLDFLGDKDAARCVATSGGLVGKLPRTDPAPLRETSGRKGLPQAASRRRTGGRCAQEKSGCGNPAPAFSV